MVEVKKMFSLILLQHILHFRWFASRIYPNIVLSKNYIKMITINLSIVIAIVSFFVSYLILKVVHNSDIEITIITANKIFIIYYIILIFYLVNNSFKEVYTRAFYSKDYYYLRLQKRSPFTLQTAKIIDVYFLEIILFILPIHLGVSLSFIIIFDLFALWSWIVIILLVFMFSLAVRIFLMLIIFFIDSRGYKKRKVISSIFRISFWIFLGWIGSFFVVQYVIKKDLFFSLLNKLKSIHFQETIYRDIWLIGACLTVIMLGTELRYLYHRQKELDEFRLGGRNKEKQINKKTENTISLTKAKSKMGTILIKDILLLIRGEYLSLGFIKSNVILFSCFLGVISALSIEFYEPKYSGIIFLIILVYQIISTELVMQSVSKISSLDLERNWLKFYYTHMKNPYFIYRSKFVLQFFILFGALSISTILISLTTNLSFNIILLLILSSFCIPLISSLSFLIGNACFPNFKWENQDQINTSITGFITENILTRLYQILQVSIVGANTVFLYAQKMTMNDFLLNNMIIIAISTLVWGLFLFLILRAPLWKGWKL